MTLQDQKHAQKVLAANEIARSIWDIDAERLGAALTLMTPSEIERLAAIVAVAGVLALPGETPPAPPKKRKSVSAPPPSAKCIEPNCAFDADTFAKTDTDLCRDHASATDEQKAAWRALKVTPPARGKRKAAEIVKQIEGAKVETKATA